MNGAILLDGTAAEIGFASTGGILPTDSFANGDLSGLTIDEQPVRSTTKGPLGGGTLGVNLEIRDVLAPEAMADLDSVARDLIERFEALKPPGDSGVFTDAGVVFDPKIETGLANCISLNTQIDPDQTDATWRLRDG